MARFYFQTFVTHFVTLYDALLFYDIYFFILAPLIEPQSTTIPVLVDSDVTSRTMTIHTPVVKDNRGEIR